MNTLLLIESAYTGILFEGVPEGLATALSTAKLVHVSGYGDSRVLEPSKSKLEIELIQNAEDPTPTMTALLEAQKKLSEESSKRYKAESELKQLKQRFGEL